jgi:serine/threonine protein kinase
MPADGIFTSPTGESYKTGSRLGVGSQGEVFEAVRKSDGEVVALKRVRKPVTAAREVAAMKAVVGQAGFAQMSDEFPHAENHVIIMNVLGKSVYKLKKSDNKLTPQTVGSIALQMIDRFETLHRLGYVHGDMYPNNLLLDASEENVIVIDFGQARPTTKGDEINKVSDARSLSHSVLRLFNPDTAFGSYQHVGSTALSKVCEGLPAPVEELFRYTHMTLTHGDGPNYNLMRSLMRKLAPGYTGKVIA